MEISYTPEAQEHLLYWKKIGNKTVQQRISKLLESISVTPTKGIGKPEQLKYALSGCWSRRIDTEHRLVYKVHADKIEVISLRFHY